MVLNDRNFRIDTLSTENERLRNLNQELQKTQIITRNPELSSNAVKGDEPKEEVNADFEGLFFFSYCIMIIFLFD